MEDTFKQHKKRFLELLNMGMPSRIIQNVLNISPQVAMQYLRKVRKDEDFTGELLSYEESLPAVLKTYAGMAIDPESLSEEDKALLPLMEEVLQVQEVLRILSYALLPLTNWKGWDNEEEIDKAWVCFLNEIVAGDVELPAHEEFKFEERKHFVRRIIATYFVDLR